MQHRPTTLERAFELARTGLYQGASDIREQLRTEGFGDARAQVSGPSLQRQLGALCRAARAEAV